MSERPRRTIFRPTADGKFDSQSRFDILACKVKPAGDHPARVSKTDRQICPLLPHQIIPGAAQRLVQAQHRGQQDIDVPGLNFLDGADVEIHPFGQFFLGDFFSHPLPADLAVAIKSLKGTACVQGL